MTTARPPLLRRRDGRLVAGVAGGIARHLGISVVLVRVIFAVLVLTVLMCSVSGVMALRKVRQADPADLF